MSKKRANGEGSVYKMKDERVIGSWQDANGKTECQVEWREARYRW